MSDVLPPVPGYVLNNGVEIPQVGFGVFKVEPDETIAAVELALDAGYRHLDTAMIYGNEAQVGLALQQSDLSSDDIFVTTKLWNSDQGYDSTMKAFDTSAHLLAKDVIDLYLIHWPSPERDLYLDTWQALSKLYADGRIRAIGVSNFQIPHLQRLLDASDVAPAVNQIELHPFLQQAELRAFHAEHGIATEAWGPLARGAVADEPVIGAIAERHGKTPAQVTVRWHLQIGNIVIPKSVTPSRVRENIDVFDFELDQDDLDQISTLERDGRTGPHPDHYDV